MKKIIILFTLLILVSCYSDSEKIQNDELCYKYKEKIQKEIDKERETLGWETGKGLGEIFYSKKESACFYVNLDDGSIVNLFNNKVVFYGGTQIDKIREKVSELKK